MQSVAALDLIGAATQGLKYPLDRGLSLVISTVSQVQSVAALDLIGAATQGLKYPLDCGPIPVFRRWSSAECGRTG